MRNSVRFNKEIPESTGGRVPIEDLTNWVEVLREGENPFTQGETKRFLDSHVVNNVMELAKQGLDEVQCLNRILFEVRKNGKELTPEGIKYFETTVASTFEAIRENS